MSTLQERFVEDNSLSQTKPSQNNIYYTLKKYLHLLKKCPGGIKSAVILYEISTGN